MWTTNIKSKSVLVAFAVLAQACSESGKDSATSESPENKQSASIYSSAPVVEARSKPLLQVDGAAFKDLNANGQLDAYEDWRLPTSARVQNLLAQMSLEEKVGMMMIDTLNADWQGQVADKAAELLYQEKMTRFIFRNPIEVNPTKVENAGFSGQSISVRQAAEYTNSIQELAEATRLGIPVVFKSNARNHYERNARAGINSSAGALSEWPKEAGLAATRDPAIWQQFARAMGQEWRALGVRAMYGYMADIATEPRWFRNHETFTEDADLAADIIGSLVYNLQGGPVSPATDVALTVKHFPGGGPQKHGLDPHYTFGKYQVYPAGQFEQHLKPFVAAIDAGAASIMPYYGVPVDLTYEGVHYQQQGMAFSKAIVTDLLRDKLGFDGYVNSDTGIITMRAWGLEDASVAERIARAINAGIDLLSGFHTNSEIRQLVETGQVSEARVDDAVARLLWEQFQLGLFENPYVDAAVAETIVGNPELQEQALDAQRKSIVLLKNDQAMLPLPKPTTGQPVRLATLGMNPEVVTDKAYGGYQVVPAETADFALVRVEVSNPRPVTGQYRSNDPTTGGRINPRTDKAWGAEDSELFPSPYGDEAALDDRLIFGGPFPYEADALSFTRMAEARSWEITPSLEQIKSLMATVGAENTVVSIYFRQPYVLDEQSQLKQAAALMATFGVSDRALMDVITGRVSPRGKLPFALPKTLDAVLDQAPDAPGFAAEQTLYSFGHGLGY